MKMAPLIGLVVKLPSNVCQNSTTSQQLVTKCDASLEKKAFLAFEFNNPQFS